MGFLYSDDGKIIKILAKYSSPGRVGVCDHIGRRRSTISTGAGPYILCKCHSADHVRDFQDGRRGGHVGRHRIHNLDRGEAYYWPPTLSVNFIQIIKVAAMADPQFRQGLYLLGPYIVSKFHSDRTKFAIFKMAPLWPYWISSVNFIQIGQFVIFKMAAMAAILDPYIVCKVSASRDSSFYNPGTKSI